VLRDAHADVQMHQCARDREWVIPSAFAAGRARMRVPGIDAESSRADTSLYDATTLTSEALNARLVETLQVELINDGPMTILLDTALWAS
jgi:hypothetical protein